MSDRDQLAELVSRTYHACIDSRPIGDPFAAIADALIAAGWRPPIQLITSHEELDALPVGAVVMDAPYPEGDVHQRSGADGLWAEPGFDALFTTRVLSLPAVLLWSPAEKAAPAE